MALSDDAKRRMRVAVTSTQVGDEITTAIDSASVGNINLPNGQILVGQVNGIGAEVAMSGGATIVANGTVTLSNAAVIAKLLTGFAAAGGVVAATDSILVAFNKVVGNFNALNALASNHIFVGSAAGTPTDVAMSGDATIVAAGTVTIANGAVTPAKQSTAARQRSVVTPFKVPAPTGADQLGLDRFIIKMPQAGSITAASVISNTATVGSGATNQYTITIRNQTTNVSISSTSVGTNGAEFAAGVPKAVTTDQNLTFAIGDIIIVRVDLKDDVGAGPTDLSSALLLTQLDYTI